MALVTCKDLVLGYDGKVVLKDLSFDIGAGDYLCIVGENGTGKSTLMKSLLGLMPLIEGEITMSDGLRDNEIGYIPQQTAVQRDFPASVQEVVLSGFLNRKGLFYGRREKDIMMANLEKLGIGHLVKHCYRELSGGQQQRVLLARALCATQKLLVLDEPVAGLDPKGIVELYQIIQRLNREEGITILMVSHDLTAAVKEASHILHLGEGKALFFGRKNDYLESAVGKAFGCSKEVSV